MTVITTKQMRSQMGMVIDLLLKGEEIELNYRSKRVIISNRLKPTKPVRNLSKAVQKLSKYKISTKLKQAKDFKTIMDNYYE
jgi:hypothetical protein